MSNKTSNKDNLFALIKSLTQGEKAFFVKSLPAKKAESTDYLTLFYAIDKFDEYNEDKLKAKLKGHLPNGQTHVKVEFHTMNMMLVDNRKKNKGIKGQST